jgi:tetratricopeptide (TPR) repeat protein
LRRDPALLARAAAASPAFVFPFRTEAIPVFEWAGQQGGAWQPKYFLALLRWFQGEMAPARELFTACGDQPRFAPFYAARAQVCPDGAARDLQRAMQLDPGQWRYGAMLTKHYLKEDDTAAALAVTTDLARRFPTNETLAVLHAKTLVANGRYQPAADLLTGLNLLPCEGSTEAHGLYREAWLMLAVQRLRTSAFDESLRLTETARQWPEHLGAGKPYPEDVDERLEDWLSYQCHLGQKNAQLAGQSLKHILDSRSQARGAGEIIRALALKESGRGDEAVQLLKNWQREEPANELARWGGEVISGHAPPLPASIQDSACRVLAAWQRHSDGP